MTRSAPNVLIWLAIAVSAPALTASMMITAHTPIITPRVVRNERSLFSVTPCQATLNVLNALIPLASLGAANFFCSRRSSGCWIASPSIVTSPSPDGLRNCSTAGPVIHDHTVKHRHDTLRVVGAQWVVCHHDNGNARIMELVDERHHLFTGMAVQVAGRLVSQDNGGVVDKRRAMATRCCWPPDSLAGT